jgi:hypothetical protein
MKSGGGSSLVLERRRARERERELVSKGERCGVLWGWCSPFIGVGEVMAGLMALTPLMAEAGLRGVLMAGES